MSAQKRREHTLDRIFKYISMLSDDELDEFLHRVEKGQDASDAMQIILLKARQEQIEVRNKLKGEENESND